MSFEEEVVKPASALPIISFKEARQLGYMTKFQMKKMRKKPGGSAAARARGQKGWVFFYPKEEMTDLEFEETVPEAESPEETVPAAENEEFGRIYLEEKKRAKEIDPARMIFLDLEMTGDARADEVLSVTLADGNGKVILDTLICPEKATRWPFTVKIHHITPKMVRHVPKIRSLAPILSRILANADEILGFSVQNDWKYLAKLDEIRELEEQLTPKIRCCQVFYDRFLRLERPDLDIGKRSLGNAMETLGIEWKGTPHSSRADTVACADVWKRIFLEQQLVPASLSEELLREKEEKEARAAEAQRRREEQLAKMKTNSENDTEDISV